MSDILASRYAFLTGARTNEGMSIVTFPDSRTVLSFEDYQTLITYLLQVPPLEDSHKGFVVIVDRRNDKWSSVRTLFLQISSFFPGTIRVVFLLKPEGVLQRALEVGYRAIAENCSFKVITCDSSVELRRFLRAEQLTMDIGGLIKYNHLEWVQHRMDIERMKSSASAIAQSLSDFGRVLRETELPNDVETTARILQIQTAERDAIKVSSSWCLLTFEATQVKRCRCLLGGLSNIRAKGIVSAARCPSDRVETQTRTPQPNQVAQRDCDRTDAGPASLRFASVWTMGVFLI
ncbi:hypothetical protein ANCCEY_11558 [Ancylostoma ceylanicum]|uniref:CRAL-TRIO domain-containing protein n=1 Tax=Ancylostoma ceylanicum TaxID=53326 RepID=A0A0D6LHG3_9BILA|nr:hypothetical protein ANCCEY_11558 [Ancylostoma ceylanicum]